jgi:type IV secretory pathway TraG/TraD family ATPase VirD4
VADFGGNMLRIQRSVWRTQVGPTKTEESEAPVPVIHTDRDVSDAQNIANMLVRTGEDSPQERYWQDAAASITAGMILHVCYAAALEGRPASLSLLAGVFTRPGFTFRETLTELLNYPHDKDNAHKWRLPTGELTRTHPVVKEKVQEMLDKEDKDFSGVLSTAKTALTLYSDPLVSRTTSASDFTIQDLVNHERPVSLYLVVPPSDKIRLRPLMRLIFTMIVNRLTEKLDFQGPEQLRNKHRLLFLIDEFPSLKRMEIFADALSYMAGFGLKAYLITQDIRQIVDEYGHNESIVSNCQVRVAFAPNQYDTAELLSKMTGTQTIRKASFNFSGSRMSPMLGHVSTHMDEIERPLMTPDEIMRLRPPKKESTGHQEKIIAPGDMLIFVSGHQPIYGTQMLYFVDPILRSRAEIPPPTKLYSIHDGGLSPQDPLPELVTRPNPTPGPKPRRRPPSSSGQDDSETTCNVLWTRGPMAPTELNRERCGSSRRSTATVSTAATTAPFQNHRFDTISARCGPSLRKLLSNSVTLPAVAATTGAIAWSGHLATIPLSLVAPLLVYSAKSRTHAYSMMFCYYAAASWPVIPGARAFFGAQGTPLIGVVLCLTTAALLAGSWGLFFTRQRGKAAVRVPLCVLIAGIPPLGVIG